MSMTKSQSARLVREGVLVEVFHHATLGSFNVSALRQHVQREAAGGARPLWARYADTRTESGDPDPTSWLAYQREIDDARVQELTSADLEDPVIFVACPPGTNGEGETHLLIDGIHRFVGRHRRGFQDFVLWMVPWGVAVAFRPDEGLAIDVPWGKKEVRDGQLVDRVG